MQKNNRGFSLFEFVIVLGVIGILALFSWPFFNNYLHRYYYKPIIEAVEPFKIAINECYEKLEKLTPCNGGMNRIPPNIIKPQGSISTLIVTQGVIIVVPVASNGILQDDTYVLTPSKDQTGLHWQSSGLSVQKGYVD